ncbi:hypothetical protein VTN31DRAFT_6888 [Thermomyces dupontii]|uniref:uncharacterized protein n=1 Tax=Talaromyces thermophilus TaxID=28565 RepID=UPI003743E4C5
MDIVLEVFDTYIGDRLYSSVLPVSLAESPKLAPYLHRANQTLPLLSDVNSYVFKPASSYFSLEPTQYAYESIWARDNVFRQSISLFLITWIFGLITYFFFSGGSYVFVFDKNNLKHPKYLKNQVWMEIGQALRAMPGLALLTAPFFVLEVRGCSKMYDRLDEAPFPLYNILQFPLFIAFTDLCIYWIHRGLHHPLVYKTLHKPHHKWIVPTPFASHAFHPLDGWSQSVPYHVFPFIFPLQKVAYVFLFVFINFWTIMIHDGEYIANNPVINGSACHTMHHLYFNYNYGQFTTLWDRVGGSYRKPNDELFRRETKMGKEEWERQSKEMEMIVKTVEGDDDRKYVNDDKKNQ